jgi:hypothetical protein
MDLRATQAAIAAQLSTAFAGTVFTAAEMPESDATFSRGVPNPIVYVLLTGSDTVELLSTDPVQQIRRLKFNLECYSMKMYGDAGMLTLRPILEAAIIGFQPPSCDRLYLVKDELSRDEDSIWTHVYNLECLTVLVQSTDSEPIIIQSFASIIDNGATVNQIVDSFPPFNEDFNSDFDSGVID